MIQLIDLILENTYIGAPEYIHGFLLLHFYLC